MENVRTTIATNDFSNSKTFATIEEITIMTNEFIRNGSFSSYFRGAYVAIHIIVWSLPFVGPSQLWGWWIRRISHGFCRDCGLNGSR
jgi:hypothetical protein